MKLTIENTDKIVTLVTDKGEVEARVWQGVTEGGVQVHCFITRVAEKDGQPPSAYGSFERDLRETAKARADIQAIPLRLIL